METKSFLLRLFFRLRLPSAMLLGLLQRTPVARIATAVEESPGFSSVGAILKSAAAAIGVLGAVDTVAGATTIYASPSSLDVVAGTPINGAAFTVLGAMYVSAWQVADGSTIPPGLNFDGLTEPGVVNVMNRVPTLTGTPTTPGTYNFTLIAWEYPGADGNATAPLKYTVKVSPDPNIPSFTRQPVALSVAPGSTAVFSAAATGLPAPSYQWKRDGVEINGATSSLLVISPATVANAGAYTVVATNSAGVKTSDPANLTLTPTNDPGRLINLSVLSVVQSSITMGFVIGGSGTNGSENLLIRATGPALAQPPFNIPGVMTAPTLTVVKQSSGAIVEQNAGWGTSPSKASLVATTATAVGAFELTDMHSLDSALVTALPVSGGGYTATVASKNSGDSGYALTEVYDATAAGAYAATTPRLVNLSCLTQIPAGGTLTVGFVVGGSTAKTVLVRVSGPTLAAAPFAIAGTMADPQLTVEPLNSPTTILAANAGWGGDAQIASVAAGVGAFAFSSAASQDSAALLTLASGTPYSVQVSSASGGGGLVLVEIYEVP